MADLIDRPLAASVRAKGSAAARPRSAPSTLTSWATPQSRRRYVVCMVLLALAAAGFSFAILAWGNPMPLTSAGFWRIAELRASQISVIVMVAFCQALATVAFQTVTGNRILTPSVMGFESLYRLVNTVAVFFLGVTGLSLLDGNVQFLGQIALLMVFAAVLYGTLLTGKRANLHSMLLIGIIVGGALGAISTLMQRMLAPTEFDILLAQMIGNLAGAKVEHLVLSIPIVVACGIGFWLLGPQLNVMALGRDVAVNLGVRHQRLTIMVLLLVSALMAVSTSLIGPMTFFGFLVAMITYQLSGTYDHRASFAMAWLVGIVVLAGAYFTLRHIFYAQGAVGIIIELVGGTVFLIHLLRKGRL